MRMSDWSSDVCSSDLQFEQIGYVRGMERLDQFLDVGGVFLVQPFDDRVDERRVEHVVIGTRRRRGGRVDGFGQVVAVALFGIVEVISPRFSGASTFGRARKRFWGLVRA